MQGKKLLTSSIALLLLTCSVFAQKPAQNLSAPQEYNAVATPISTITINMGFNDMDRGVVTYTPMPGTFFKGPILNTKGEVIEQGDLLISLDKGYRIADVENAKANLAKDKAILVEKKEVYLRDKKLAETHSVSLQDYQSAYSDYLQAEAQVKADKAALLLKEKILSFCDYYAKFDGIVNKVIFSAGYTGGERPIMEVSQLFPMGIDIKMPRELAVQINVDTPITVYPLNSDEPIGVMHGASKLTKDGIQLIVNNYPVCEDYKEVNGKKIRVVHMVDTVMPFDFLDQDDPSALAINIECLVREGNNTFVYKAAGEKNGIPNKGINPVITLEKVKVVPGDRINRITPSVNYVELKDPGSLKILDIVLRADEMKKKELKDGDKAYYYYDRERYLFMPGDPVKVIIGGNSK